MLSDIYEKFYSVRVVALSDSSVEGIEVFATKLNGNEVVGVQAQSADSSVRAETF